MTNSTTAVVEGSGDNGTVQIDGKQYPVEIVNGNRQVRLEDGKIAVLSDSNGKFPEMVKGPTKLELKRAQAHMERVKRMINKGMDPSKVEAAIAEEDYRALPVERKFEMLLHSVKSAIGGFAGDINELRHNDGIISDVIDVNARAFSKIFTKLGISLEEQSTLIKEADAEIRAEFQKRLDDRNEAQRQVLKDQAEKAEKKTLDDLKKAEAKDGVSPEQIPADPNPIPEGATTFGD